MTTLLPLVITCLIGHTQSAIPPVQGGVADCDARVISNAVEKRYSKGPLVLKGEYFRNWSHIEEPFVIHIQTRSIMDEGLIATVFYEVLGDEKKFVAGVAFVLDEVIEFSGDGSFVRYPSTSPFGPMGNDYKHGCSTATAWNTWMGVAVPGEYSGRLEYFIDLIEHADSIQPYKNGWTVHSSSSTRKEEVVILSDGSIEAWRSSTPPGEEESHSSLARQYRWFDAQVETDVLREELAVWTESPDLKSLEALVSKHVALAEEHAKKIKSAQVEEVKESNEISVEPTKEDPATSVE